ncbi:hypothetical protein ACE6H2_020270 [Prunus campanulata]
MATLSTLSCYSLHPLSSASSSSTTSLTANHSLPHQPQSKPEIPLLFRCSATIAARPEVIIQPTRLFVQPILLFAGFDRPLDTQTFLATISVLAAIALSLFLGLKDWYSARSVQVLDILDGYEPCFQNINLLSLFSI